MRIAIVRLSALGDIVQSMIILQFIKKGLPNCEIDWVVDEKFSEIVKLNSLISNVITVNLSEIKKQKNFFSLFATLKRLRKLEKYDYVFDIQGLIKSALISRLIPSYKTIGYDKKSVRESLASSFYSEKYSIPYEKNVVVRYCKLVEKSLMIKITKHEILNKEPFFALERKKKSKQKIISIVVGASFESKIYPLSNYQVLVDNIDAKFICLWGNNNEFTKAQEFSKNNLNVEVSKKTSMKELLDIICSSCKRNYEVKSKCLSIKKLPKDLIMPHGNYFDFLRRCDDQLDLLVVIYGVNRENKSVTVKKILHIPHNFINIDNNCKIISSFFLFG